MLQLIQSLGENEQHVIKASDLAGIVPNDGYLCRGAPKYFPMLKFEPCTLYRKKSMEPVHAFIVKKGEGPYTWTKEITRIALMCQGKPIIFTNGMWQNVGYAKSLGSNLCRKFNQVNRSTLMCVINVNNGNPDKVCHEIFKVVEVICDQG